jgi:hypothetical protein
MFLAILLVLGGGVIALVGVPMLRQDVAIGRIKMAGGGCHLRDRPPEWLWHRVTYAIWDAKWLGKSRGKFTDLFELVTEADLRRNTAGPEVNQVLANLKCLIGLRRVNVSETQVDDSGLVYLDGIASLEVLNLRETLVTDAGLVHLRRLSGLQRLSLSDTEISDEGLKHLEPLTNLRELAVIRTHVTDAGVRDLKRALPDLVVITRDDFFDPPKPE